MTSRLDKQMNSLDQRGTRFSENIVIVLTGIVDILDPADWGDGLSLVS